MKFPESLLARTQRQLQEGQPLAHLKAWLVLELGYTQYVADLILASAQEASPHWRPPATGTRPDVVRDANGNACVDIETAPNHRAHLFAELAAPPLLLFRNFLPLELTRRVNEQVAQKAMAADVYTERGDSNHDHLLPYEGAALECVQAAARALNWPAAKWGLPIVRDTAQGTGFRLHYDGFSPDMPADVAFLSRFPGNYRIGTLLIYFESAQEGGSTYFANLGLKTNLSPGDAVFFSYPPMDHKRSGLLHGGEEVRLGNKRILTLFCYQLEFER